MRGWARWKQVTAGCGGLLIAGFACMMFFFFRDQAAFEKLPADVRTATVAARQTAHPPKPTKTPRPTEAEATDEPTEAPEPTATEEPVATEEPTATNEPEEPTATDSPTDEPPPTPDAQGVYDDIKPIMETMHREVGAIVFQNLRVSTNPPRCTFIVTDIWYGFKDFEKERLVETVADLCAVATAKRGLRGPAPKPGDDWGNYPTTSFVDSFDKEVAYRSAWRTKVIK